MDYKNFIPLENKQSKEAAKHYAQLHGQMDHETKALLQQVKAYLAEPEKRNSEPPTYLDKQGVADLLGLSTKSIDNMRKKAILPEPKNIPLNDIPEGAKGRKVLRWRTQEVIEWVDQY